MSENCVYHRGLKVTYVSPTMQPLCIRCKEELDIHDVQPVLELAQKEINEITRLEKSVSTFRVCKEPFENSRLFEETISGLRDDPEFFANIQKVVADAVMKELEAISGCYKKISQELSDNDIAKKFQLQVAKHNEIVKEAYKNKKYMSVVHSIPERNIMEHNFESLRKRIEFFEALKSNQGRKVTISQLGVHCTDFTRIIQDLIINQIADSLNQPMGNRLPHSDDERTISDTKEVVCETKPLFKNELEFSQDNDLLLSYEKCFPAQEKPKDNVVSTTLLPESSLPSPHEETKKPCNYFIQQTKHFPQYSKELLMPPPADTLVNTPVITKSSPAPQLVLKRERISQGEIEQDLQSKAAKQKLLSTDFFPCVQPMFMSHSYNRLLFVGRKSKESMKSDTDTARFIREVFDKDSDNEEKINRIIAYLRERQTILYKLEFNNINVKGKNEALLFSILKNVSRIPKLKFVSIKTQPNFAKSMAGALLWAQVDKLGFEYVKFSEVELSREPFKSIASIKPKALSFVGCKFPFAKGCIGNEWAYLMMSIEGLQYLKIAECQMDDLGLCSIKETLKRHKSLRKLDLSYSEITAKGVQQLIEGCKENTIMKDLVLRGIGTTFDKISEELSVPDADRQSQLNLYID